MKSSAYQLPVLSVIVLLVLLAGAGNATAQRQTVLVFGDSLSSAYRMPEAEGWVTLLAEKLADEGWSVQVANGSVAGATTTSGTARLPNILEYFRPTLVILELGGNDGLRGLPLEVMRVNLTDMIKTIQQYGAEVLLVGIRIPPNYGSRYTEPFFNTYSELAELYDLPLVPFMLEDIAEHPELMQNDGIHPTAEAQPLIVDNIWPVLEPMLREMVKR
ncbi:MAG: arylesterase [Pseudohongiellaceae bacterium]